MSTPTPNVTPEFIAQLRASKDTKLIAMADSFQAQLDKSNSGNKYLDKFITADANMLSLKDKVRKLMHEDIDDPVLIIGETGTGKEILARALHNGREGSFVAVNCAGLPEQLIESELFGHIKGAFTGAVSDKKGMFEEAVDGTIFLDEVGELPLNVQAKLLRTIQERSVRKVGGNTETKISARLVCATHRRLDHDLEGKSFRRDLFWRISTFVLYPTPLRDRLEDVPLILKSLEEPDKPLHPDMSSTIQGLLQICGFAGNVRSLQQIVRRYYVLGEMP